jgi:hypothetical protein
MSQIEVLEKQILGLPKAERDTLRDWFLELESESWDLQIESDVSTGKLKPLEEAARAQILAGQWRPL